MKRAVHGCLVGGLVLSLAASALAQESTSAALAKQLTDALDAAKSTTFAAPDGSQPNGFVAAMYLPGTLLVVSARFAAPAAIASTIAKKDYQEAYIDLQSASDTSTKIFVQDFNADGLKFKTFDSLDTAKGSTTFDGDWKKAKAASEEDYQKAFSDADSLYAKMLTTLLTALKK